MTEAWMAEGAHKRYIFLCNLFGYFCWFSNNVLLGQFQHHTWKTIHCPSLRSQIEAILYLWRNPFVQDICQSYTGWQMQATWWYYLYHSGIPTIVGQKRLIIWVYYGPTPQSKATQCQGTRPSDSSTCCEYGFTCYCWFNWLFLPWRPRWPRRHWKSQMGQIVKLLQGHGRHASCDVF